MDLQLAAISIEPGGERIHLFWSHMFNNWMTTSTSLPRGLAHEACQETGHSLAMSSKSQQMPYLYVLLLAHAVMCGLLSH